MLCEYSHTNSECLAQIHATIAEIQHFFQGIVFLLVRPVDTCGSEKSPCICVDGRGTLTAVSVMNCHQRTTDLFIFLI